MTARRYWQDVNSRSAASAAKQSGVLDFSAVRCDAGNQDARRRLMADLGVILGDLDAETRTIDDVVADLPASGWARETPAAGWTIAHQVAHLAWTDRKALIAAAHPEDWQAEVEELLKAGETYVDDGAAAGARRPPREILEDWRSGRAALTEALAAVPDGQKLPWYGP